MKNVSDKSCRKNQNAYFEAITFFIFKNRAVYEIMYANIAQSGSPHMAILRRLIAFRIPKATNTHSGYVILIDFPQ